MRRKDVASTSFRRHVPTRFLINRCQIITFLILKSGNIENPRIELKGIVLPVPSNQIKVIFIIIQHFFFHCTKYQAQRNELINAISPYQYPSLNLFLYGDLSMPQDINSIIFEKVYKYIIHVSTKRF